MLRKKFNEDKNFFSALFTISYLLFITILIWAIYFKLNRYSSILSNYRKLIKLSDFERFTYNIVPFTLFSTKDFILNTIAFAPFGIYLPFIFKKHSHLKGLAVCFLVSLTVELTQFATVVGTFSTNDLIANTLGYLVGAFFFTLIVKKLPIKIINYANVAIIALASPFALYGIIKTARNLAFYVTKT